MTGAPEAIPVRASGDVALVRRAVREAAEAAGLGLVAQTKVVTAASELARNALVHGGGGWALVEVAERAGKRGVRVTVEDEGPGIPDLERALADGFTTGGGLGLGLGGSRRLSNEFEVAARPGGGTRVVIARWS